MAEDFSIGADYAASMNEIGQRFDTVDRTLAEHSRTLAFHGQQLTELSRKLDDQDIALYNLTAIMERHSRDIRGIKTELVEVNGKLDQVIALLTKQGE